MKNIKELLDDQIQLARVSLLDDAPVQNGLRNVVELVAIFMQYMEGEYGKLDK